MTVIRIVSWMAGLARTGLGSIIMLNFRRRVNADNREVISDYELWHLLTRGRTALTRVRTLLLRFPDPSLPRQVLV